MTVYCIIYTYIYKYIYIYIYIKYYIYIYLYILYIEGDNMQKTLWRLMESLHNMPSI